MSTTRSGDGLVGQVLDDRYEIVRRLARGGMAVVYLAHDLRLSRTVAIKVLHEGLGDDADFVRRFDTEARAAAHLSHPNVVSVFDQGIDRGRPFIVMEYVEGCTLRHIITREAPMEPLRALDLMEPVVAALAAAHTAGMVHRDIKPENVLISERGQVKVADFGLARAVTAQTNTATTGLVIGTVSYIAPELVTKGSAGPESDVYSLGIVLYEMLTGHKPHTGDTPIQVAYSHVHNQIPAPSMELSTSWRDSRTRIPPYLDALVTSAANRDRQSRPADADVLLAHLRAARDALARGVTTDADLTARMRQQRIDVEAGAPERVPSLVGAYSLAGAPREVRFTPSTPVSPSFDFASDGAPYYSDGGPGPYSPASPHTRTLPVLTEEKPRRRPRRSSDAGRIVSLLVALLSIAGLVYGGWYLAVGRYVDAPALGGLTQQAAQTAAQQAGLGIVFEREYSETVPVGRVTRTEPGDGERILGDGTITAYLSRGPERYPVPDLAGLSRQQALTRVIEGELAVGNVAEEYSDTVPSGTIISQAMEPGTQVKKGVPVDFVISKGPAPVDLPDFAGRPFEEAKAWLEGNGLAVAATEEHSRTVPAGSVIRQDPGAGTVHRGDTVTLVNSQGPVMVKVPEVRGLGVTAASARLQGAGFQVKVVRMVSGSLGFALRTDPGADKLAPEASTITLYVV